MAARSVMLLAFLLILAAPFATVAQTPAAAGDNSQAPGNSVAPDSAAPANASASTGAAAMATAPANTVAPTNAGASPNAAAPTGAGAPNGAAAPKGAALDDDVTFLAPFVYDAREGRRNPFQPPVVLDNSSTNSMLPGSPMERFDLDQIKLIGIMWNIKHPKAMFADPGGAVHVLGLDDRIGRKHGYIAAIREGEVVIVEPSQYNGQQTYSTRVLHIEQETTNAN